MHLLLAEHDDKMRTTLASALWRHGFRVSEACDGSRALDYLIQIALSGNRERLPHVLVANQRLPGFCGLAVIEAARIGRMGIPAILMTASGDAETRNRASLLGATRVLEKPFEIDDFLTLIRRVASLRMPLRSLPLSRDKQATPHPSGYPTGDPSIGQQRARGF
jgi:DNA-binding response OmpR family regulator